MGREPARVADDAATGRWIIEASSEINGVVLDGDGGVDNDPTEDRRTAIRQ